MKNEGKLVSAAIAPMVSFESNFSRHSLYCYKQQ
jgi:hypothetical protein